jgi:hypothetical protein
LLAVLLGVAVASSFGDLAGIGHECCGQAFWGGGQRWAVADGL